LFQFKDGTAVCTRDIVFDVFWLATCQEEQHCPRDKHGWLDLTATPFGGDGVTRMALGSAICCSLEKLTRKLGLPPPLPRWPQGKKAAACMSHDVDYPEVVRWLEPLRVFRRQGLRGLPAAAAVLAGRRGHWHFASWVELEQRLNTRSAFFFAARKGSLAKYALGLPDPFYDIRSPRFQELFAFLLDRGFEIGLHASYGAHESPAKLLEEKLALEEASGQPVYGNRHHYLHLGARDPEATLLAHEQVGLKYDTTVFHERYVGWRAGICWPYFPFHQKEERRLGTVQIPTAWMDIQLFTHKSDNPGHNAEILRSVAERTLALGGCLLIDVHVCHFDDVLHPGIARACQDLWESVAANTSIWIDAPGQIVEHWLQRHSAILRASRGLDAEGAAL
jgi:hypothetical protein